MEMVFTFTLAATTPVTFFPPCINLLSTVRYCKFLRLFRLALRSVVPPPTLSPKTPLPLPLYLPSRISPPVGFDKHVVLLWRCTSF